eukprot:GEZU01011146.1.p1 GENE.GEZU01011146.1~~GEZU01011146.1.p1  ORF type:complete len:131 (+),score=25.43 GEZU01011146.1:48-440(+)
MAEDSGAMESEIPQIEGDDEIEIPKLEIIPGPDSSVATFVFGHESHTLGNSLRHILMKNPQVTFCGYTVPHPLEPRMNLRVQTAGNISAIQAVENGLKDTIRICEHVQDVFDAQLEQFKANNNSSSKKSK